MKPVGHKVSTMLREKGKNSRRNEQAEPKQKQHRVVDVTGDRSKVQCCKSNIALEPGILGP